jgi:ABC-type phosphate/phosphonate transport system substrate-binding protein
MYFKILIFIFLPLFLYSNETTEEINVAYYSGIDSKQLYKNSRSALNIWVNDFTKNIHKNIHKNINMNIYTNKEEIFKDYISNKMDIVAISAHSYLLNKKKYDDYSIDYWELRRSEIKPLQKMYLLVNTDSNINSILDLKNKKIGIDIENKFGKIFFEKTYLDGSKKNANDIISKIDYNKSNSLLLKTYFAKYDAAVITSYEYEVMIELNPAITKKIKILKSSPEIFPHIIILFHKNNIGKNIKTFKSTLSEFFKSENKQELFDILEIKDLSMSNKKNFDNLNEYYIEYLKLKSKFKK